MYYTIRPFFTKNHNLLIDNIKTPFIEYVKDADNAWYSFEGGFELYKEPNGEKVAVVLGQFFNEINMLNDGADIIEIADMIDQSTYDAIYYLSKSKLYQEEIDIDKVSFASFSCYIERVYVYPKYRNKKLGHYIFNNLDRIFEFCFNTPIHCFVIYPYPQVPENDSWVNADDENNEMKLKMIGVIKECGFEQLDKSDYYAKNCASAYK
jgi:hypothetical protein